MLTIRIWQRQTWGCLSENAAVLNEIVRIQVEILLMRISADVFEYQFRIRLLDVSKYQYVKHTFFLHCFSDYKFPRGLEMIDIVIQICIVIGANLYHIDDRRAYEVIIIAAAY